MIDKARRVLRKYIEFIITKIKIIWEQKVFEHEDVKVKYIFKGRKDADTLVVIFSACTRKGLKARYNYMKTLNGIRCNRLYILDDYAADGRGSYYIGRDFRFNEEVAVKALISKFIDNLQPGKTIFCGSSKGGYAAINFGVEFPNSYMVIGGPQYYLTTYLKAGNNITLDYILGEHTPEKEEQLEFRLWAKIRENVNVDSQKVYIHYSNQEHTYGEHIIHMLKDMEEKNYCIISDVADYKNHSDISFYFPDFLRKQIISIVEEM